jgi:hypothetical protein
VRCKNANEALSWYVLITEFQLLEKGSIPLHGRSIRSLRHLIRALKGIHSIISAFAVEAGNRGANPVLKIKMPTLYRNRALQHGCPVYNLMVNV